MVRVSLILAVALVPFVVPVHADDPVKDMKVHAKCREARRKLERTIRDLRDEIDELKKSVSSLRSEAKDAADQIETMIEEKAAHDGQCPLAKKLAREMEKSKKLAEESKKTCSLAVGMLLEDADAVMKSCGADVGGKLVSESDGIRQYTWVITHYGTGVTGGTEYGKARIVTTSSSVYIHAQFEFGKIVQWWKE